ncbi:YdcF family protein [Spirosoma montaniterrae]|uniref:DUF218 domain-containing protein n=1 Tax=Spirosoma montaniterrae TaxID=1178516 RepID=A0A1P9WZF8_9BACT|nr:YdcF family protein [Spirosoma montaniterrae]AQG80752.1 hypothetical protein AWR27_16350 [Spirosoma montaniterrae]
MFYFFSKTISYVLTPAGWLVMALCLALFTKNHTRRRRLIGAALGLFWLFGNSFLTNELALWWEYPPTAVPRDSVNRVAVVLTGGMTNAEKNTPDYRYLLDREADRAGQALYLYKTGAVQKILISGGMGSLPFRAKAINDEGQMTARFLRTAGVRADDLVLESQSRNTHENAVFSARMLRNRFPASQYRYVLVTSAWHMRRAVACFRKEGVAVTPFPGAFLSVRRSFAPGEWLFPNEQAFTDAYFLMREITGYITYWIAGYI